MEGLRKTTRRQNRTVTHQEPLEESQVPFEGHSLAEPKLILISGETDVEDEGNHDQEELNAAAGNTNINANGRVASMPQPASRPDVAAQKQAQQELIAALNENQEMVAGVARARTPTPYHGGARPRRANQGDGARIAPDAPPLTQEVLNEVIERTCQAVMAQNQRERRTPSGIRQGLNNRPRSQSESSGDDDSHVSRTSSRPQYSPKLPPFTGKEKWEVWFTRFTDVASLNQWGDRRRSARHREWLSDRPALRRRWSG